MTEQPTQDPFEPYRPGPVGSEQHPYAAAGAKQQPPPWAAASPYGYGAVVPDHPQAVTVMVLGIVSFFFPIVGPVAWVLGGRAKREIEASGGRLGGMSQVMVGYVLGIVMSVLMALVLVLFLGVMVVVVVVAVAAGT